MVNIIVIKEIVRPCRPFIYFFSRELLKIRVAGNIVQNSDLPAENVVQSEKKMASKVADDEYLDVLLSLIEDDILETDEELNSLILEEGHEIPLEAEKPIFTCSVCSKVCLSKGGLTRHTKAKHQLVNDGAKANDNTEDILHPLHLKKYIHESLGKLAKDTCFPSVQKEFENATAQFVSMDDVLPVYTLVRPVVTEFISGKTENFLTKFYKVVRMNSKEPSPFKMSKNSNLLFGYDLANFVKVHLESSTSDKAEKSVKSINQTLSAKENDIICYLSGYVFGTLYRRIRLSSNCSTNIYHKHCLSILLAGKIEDTDTTEEHHKLVNIRDRGGLWKARTDVCKLFTVVELHIREVTGNLSSRVVDSKKIVQNLSNDAHILLYYKKIMVHADIEKLNEEVSLNLLEDLIMLYVRVRVFSIVKEIKTAHNIEKSKSKLKSLRKELKKSSLNLDQGH